MIDTTVGELVELLGCPPPDGSADESAHQSALITSVVVDSRLVTPGCLFVALPGERTDGHAFVEQAWRDGAVACVTAREIPGGPCLVVSDPLTALGQIGALVVAKGKRAGLRVVGITGSQGKTSTKDLLAQILDRAGATVAPTGSFNNEIGVPLTACRITAETRFLVSEMGARGQGHIGYLCRLTPPDVGVVLNVGSAHLGMFGSQQAIAQAKGELVEALTPDGVAVLNLTDPLVAAMADRTTAHRFGFCEPGRDPVADRPVELAVVAEDPSPDEAGRWAFTLRLLADESSSGESADHGYPVRLQSLGRHQIGNALAAATAAVALGVQPGVIAAGLTGAELRSRWRMEVNRRPDGLTLINDAYNANPGSMVAALNTLAELGTSRRQNGIGVRTVAVLGDMLELGDATTAEHEAIGAKVAALGVDRLLAVGAEASSVVDGALRAGYPKERASMFSSVAELGEAISADLTGADIVLLKASRSVGLEVLAEPLLAEPGSTTSDAPPSTAPEARS